MFEEGLRAQGLNFLLDIRDEDPNAVMRIPFWEWQAKADEVLRELHPHRDDDTFKWCWPLISNILPLCQAVVTARALEIAPPCPPIEKFPSFAEAKRRIYLTATLADDSVLVTHFDADVGSVATSVAPDTAADLGDRLVLAMQELNPDVVHEQLRDVARAIAVEHNVVVLAPSWRQARLWEPEAAAMASEVARLTVELHTCGPRW